MSNTKDLIGEQETLDRLISHNLESFEDSDIKSLRDYCFYNNKAIKNVNLPNCEQNNAKAYVFGNCYNIHTISLPLASRIGTCQFANCYKLKNITLNNNTTIGESAFQNCFSLNNINNGNDLTSITQFGSNCFSYSGIGKLTLLDSVFGNSYLFRYSRVGVLDLVHDTTKDNPRLYYASLQLAFSLVHLIIRRNTTIVTPTSAAFLDDTPIKAGIGWIYVPSNLVDTYKSATNWSAYADQIVPIEQYPKPLQNETISDSWEEIFQAEDNNTYKSKYNVGDIKYLIVGETYVPMQIVAFDRDTLSSNENSTAKITWISKGLPLMYPMNIKDTSTTNRWEDSDCRAFLRDTIYPQIDSVVRNRIVPVDKTCVIYTTNSYSTDTISDTLWIPSAKEIYGGTSYENDGVDYTDFFDSAVVRRKNIQLSTTGYGVWWLRSVSGVTTYRAVNSGSSSAISGSTPQSIQYVALCFCT